VRITYVEFAMRVGTAELDDGPLGGGANRLKLIAEAILIGDAWPYEAKCLNRRLITITPSRGFTSAEAAE
jgi:hypothetical protein